MSSLQPLRCNGPTLPMYELSDGNPGLDLEYQRYSTAQNTAQVFSSQHINHDIYHDFERN